MKKTLLTIAMVLMTALGGRVWASDTLTVRQLSYKSITISTTETSLSDTLTADVISEDIRFGFPIKGYTFTLTDSAFVLIDVSFNSFDGYIYLLNSSYTTVHSNDDCNNYTSSCMKIYLAAGTYYILVTSYNISDWNDGAFTLTASLSDHPIVSIERLAWNNIAPDTVLTDSLTEQTPCAIKGTDFKGATNGYTFTVSNAKFYEIMLQSEEGMQATLYDESFNEIDFAGSYSDRPLTQYLDEGRYYITVSGYSFDIYGKYTLQLSKWEVPITTLIDYTYTTLPAFGTEISDSIHGALPALVNYGNDNGRYVQGYKFQGAKDKIMTLDITSGPVTNLGEYDKDRNINLIVWLLNSKFEKVQEFNPDPYYTATEYYLLREDSTYYLVFMPQNIKDEGLFSFSVTLEELKDYYISADAEGTGLSPESPAASINEILWEADGPGRYHLMSDLDLSALMGSYIHTGYVLPYDRDVKITFTPDPDICYETFDILEGDITLGSSEHKIIFENIPLNEIDVPFGTSILKYNFYAKIENVEIRNCSMENILSGYSGEIILKNVTLTYDTLESIARNCTNYTMTGCNISNNLIEDGLATAYSSNFYSTTYTQNNEEQIHIENCTVKNNIFSQPAIMSLGVDLTIRQSEISDNSLDVDEDVLAEFASTGLTEDNLAGIFIASAELNIDGSFKMDTANYVVLLDTNSYVNITEPVTAPTAMTIIPLDLSLGIPSLFYFEGRKVIGGDEDLVSANYKHFRLAQRGETPWYIQADGRIYTTSGIEDVQRDNATAVFPNPASSAVVVNGLEYGDNVRLMDINGRVVVNRQATGNSMNINLSSLNSGIYFVQVVDGDKVVSTTKLIKK